MITFPPSLSVEAVGNEHSRRDLISKAAYTSTEYCIESVLTYVHSFSAASDAVGHSGRAVNHQYTKAQQERNKSERKKNK
jgi:hypothetical protein